ncbi:MAG: helicase-associated domain-containing protein [Microthrixaceae bacterium]|nr:helicase-associated domain-containing protein [Microthrixaceae bacterium]
MTDPSNPLIVQSDMTVLLETASPAAAAAAAALARFAELEKAPEHVHTYRITPLSLWNAAVAGLSAAEVEHTLARFAKYDVSPSVLAEVVDQMGRYGRLRLVRDHDTAALALTSDEPPLIEEVSRERSVAELLGERLDGNRIAVRLGDRGRSSRRCFASVGRSRTRPASTRVRRSMVPS